jgi:hypothetical protein
MKRVRNRHVSCEPMENRLMFVTINGTNAANAISVSIDGNDILYAVDGVSDRVLDVLHSQIEINGLGGNDTITIVETGNNTVTVNGGSGADTINLALGANDMDTIDDFVTINGDGDIDRVTINDQNNNTTATYNVTSANTLVRLGVPAITANVEDVQINAPTAFNSGLNVDAVSTFDLRYVGSPTHVNPLIVTGNGTQTLNYRPDDFTNGDGEIAFGSANIDFEDVASLTVNSMALATFTTPNVTDVMTISKGGGFLIHGTSTGVAMTGMQVNTSTAVAIDMAANDSSAATIT